MERVRHFVGRHVIGGSRALLLIMLGTAAHQFYTSWDGMLSPWKGGGFGMYTAPHPENARATYLIVDGHALRMAPPDPKLVAWIASVDPGSAQYLERLVEQARTMRSYPRAAAADRLMAGAARVIWDKVLLDAWLDVGVQPASEMEVVVMEIARRPSESIIETRIIFSHAGE